MKRRRKKNPEAGPRFAPMCVQLFGYPSTTDGRTSTEIMLMSLQAPKPGYILTAEAAMAGYIVTRVIVVGGDPIP